MTGEIASRIKPLAEWTRKFKSAQRHLTLTRNDYDALRRWPSATRMHGIDVIGEAQELWFKGLELTYDGGPRRYPLNHGPVQADLVEQLPEEVPG